MAERKNPSKRLRFEIFKRDNFTCQYCGAQPPEVVLEIDHVHPVAEGGKTTVDNLITACEPCNRGKGKTLLGDRAVRPDADLMYLATQQEIAELKRFQAAEKERDELLEQIACDVCDRWAAIDEPYAIDESVILQMLRSYSPEVVHEAALIVAKKDADGFFDYNVKGIIPYLWGVAKRISARKEELGGLEA